MERESVCVYERNKMLKWEWEWEWELEKEKNKWGRMWEPNVNNNIIITKGASLYQYLFGIF